MENKERVVTSIDDLITYKLGQFVELPPFAEGMPFCARMRRPSLLALAKAGKIPNTLLNSANKLFFGRQKNERLEDDALEKMFEVIDVLCEAAFVSPTWDEIRQSGIDLTDDQYMFVFNYTQQGVKALEPFRREPGDTQSHSNDKGVEQAPV